MTRFFSIIFRPFSSLNAAEATVLSFLFMSLIGGIAIWGTEMHRDVVVKEPYLQRVMLTPADSDGASASLRPRTEMHTFTREARRKGETFIDTLFTSVSALCVTGLISTDFSRFTLAGQMITLVLIQMGGLGIIVFTSIFALLIARGLSERETFRDLLAGILDTDGHKVWHMIRHVILYTIVFEGLGFLIMGLHLNANPELIGDTNPWWWALFHSVSAFNNAGFGLMNNNLMSFVKDPVINLTIAALIILGGLGYPVLIAIHAFMRRKLVRHKDEIQRLLDEDVQGVVASPVQTKVAIWGSLFFLALGTFIPLTLEWGSPMMREFNWAQKLMIAFFQSASTRTAGFNTVDIGALGTSTLILFMVLMYIGANPAGTAGGIKIPTVAVLYGYVKDWFKEPGQPVMLFSHRISKFALSHAIRLFFFSTLFIGLVVFLITAAESRYLITPDPMFNFTKIIFEVISAFGTVGLSMGYAGGVTSFAAIMTPFSKLLIILTMLFGRLGPLTILASLPWKRRFAGHPPSPDFENTEKIQIG
jgi:trk system potassium uptake protein